MVSAGSWQAFISSDLSIGSLVMPIHNFPKGDAHSSPLLPPIHITLVSTYIRISEE
jgi:hypothetical protein